MLLTIQRQCTVCKKRISYRASSTNNLHMHLRTVHPSVQWEDKTQSVGCDINEGASVSTAAASAYYSSIIHNTAVYVVNHQIHLTPQTKALWNRFCRSLCVYPARQNSVDEELAKMIALDFQPFSVVDDKGFRKFIHAIPSSKTKKSSQAYMTENMHHCKRGLKKPQQSV